MEPIKLKNPASAFMLFLLVFSIVISIIMELVIIFVLIPANMVPDTIFRSMWYIIFMQIVRLLLPLLIWLVMTKDSFKRHMPTQPMGALNYVYVVFISLLAIPAMMLVSGITSLFVNNDVADFLAEASGSGYSWLVMMLAIAVTPGIIEELVFRGYIQSTSRGSIRKIAIFNGLLFAIMHLNLHQFMYTFLLGIFFAYMLYYTRNIWSVIISHFLVNGVNVTLAHWAMQSVDYVDTAAEQTFSQIMYESLVTTDPELAQRAYDMFHGIDVTWIAIGMIGFFAIFATIGAAALFYALVQHNKKGNAAFDSEKVVDEVIMDEVTDDSPPHSKIDICFILVIVIYIAFTIVLPLFV